MGTFSGLASDFAWAPGVRVSFGNARTTWAGPCELPWEESPAYSPTRVMTHGPSMAVVFSGGPTKSDSHGKFATRDCCYSHAPVSRLASRP